MRCGCALAVDKEGAPGLGMVQQVEAVFLSDSFEGIVVCSRNPRTAMIERHAKCSAFGIGAPTDAIGGFYHDDRSAGLLQSLGRGKPGNSSADNNHIRV